MEGQIIFMDLKIQYFHNVNSLKIHIELQCLPYKNSSRIIMEFDTLISNNLQNYRAKK